MRDRSSLPLQNVLHRKTFIHVLRALGEWDRRNNLLADRTEGAVQVGPRENGKKIPCFAVNTLHQRTSREVAEILPPGSERCRPLLLVLDPPREFTVLWSLLLRRKQRQTTKTKTRCPSKMRNSNPKRRQQFH